MTEPSSDTSAISTRSGAGFRWWFFPLMFLIFFLPPMAQRGFSLEAWSAVLYATLFGAWINSLTFIQPYIHAVFLTVLVLTLWNPERFMRFFNAYAAISYFIFAIVQSTAWTHDFGYSVVTSNFLWFSIVGVAWAVEASSPPVPERRLRFHAWHLWAIPLCVFAFWTPMEPWYFHPKYLIWSLSTLAFCLMTPIYITIHGSYYPHANTKLLQVTGWVGFIVATINFVTALSRHSLYNGAIHVPLMVISCLALVLAFRQRRLNSASARSEAVPLSPKAAVSVRSLTKRYNGKAAVDDVSFEVGRGEIFGLLGPNGAGKTTTVECIAGLRDPDGGQIRVEGLDPTLDMPALRRCLGIQLQKAALPDGLSVGEAGRFFAQFFGNVVDPALPMEQLDLAACRDTLYGKLSGGQKQRLHFLIALLGDPQVLIADEPTTGLDPVARQVVWQMLRERKARGKSIILTTHFMQEAEALCDRLAFIRNGRIVAEGSPDGLIAGLGWKVQVAVRLDRPCPLDTLRTLPKITNVTQEDARLLVYGTEASVLGDVLGTVARAACVVQDVKTHEASLDDVFVALAGEGAAEAVEQLQGEERP